MKKSQILRKNWEFQNIVDLKHQIVTNSLVIYYKENENSLRVGISIPKKFLIAAKRNYIRRQLRKILTECIDFETLKYDVVLIVRKPFIERKFKDKEELVKVLFRKLKAMSR